MPDVWYRSSNAHRMRRTDSRQRWQLCKTDRGATDCINLLHFNCRNRRCIGRAVGDTESDHFSYSTAAGSIECDRKGWLQQTAAHTRNRIRKRRGLSLSRGPTCGLPRPDVIGIESAVLRFKHQGTLSIGPGSVAAKGASIHEIT